MVWCDVEAENILLFIHADGKSSLLWSPHSAAHDLLIISLNNQFYRRSEAVIKPYSTDVSIHWIAGVCLYSTDIIKYLNNAKTLLNLKRTVWVTMEHCSVSV